jgi:hypothetical protein
MKKKKNEHKKFVSVALVSLLVTIVLLVCIALALPGNTGPTSAAPKDDNTAGSGSIAEVKSAIGAKFELPAGYNTTFEMPYSFSNIQGKLMILQPAELSSSSRISMLAITDASDTVRYMLALKDKIDGLSVNDTAEDGNQDILVVGKRSFSVKYDTASMSFAYALNVDQ